MTKTRITHPKPRGTFVFVAGVFVAGVLAVGCANEASAAPQPDDLQTVLPADGSLQQREILRASCSNKDATLSFDVDASSARRPSHDGTFFATSKASWEYVGPRSNGGYVVARGTGQGVGVGAYGFPIYIREWVGDATEFALPTGVEARQAFTLVDHAATDGAFRNLQWRETESGERLHIEVSSPSEDAEWMAVEEGMRILQVTRGRSAPGAIGVYEFRLNDEDQLRPVPIGIGPDGAEPWRQVFVRATGKAYPLRQALRVGATKVTGVPLIARQPEAVLTVTNVVPVNGRQIPPQVTMGPTGVAMIEKLGWITVTGDISLSTPRTHFKRCELMSSFKIVNLRADP